MRVLEGRGLPGRAQTKRALSPVSPALMGLAAERRNQTLHKSGREGEHGDGRGNQSHGPEPGTTALAGHTGHLRPGLRLLQNTPSQDNGRHPPTLHGPSVPARADPHGEKVSGSFQNRGLKEQIQVGCGHVLGVGGGPWAAG